MSQTFSRRMILGGLLSAGAGQALGAGIDRSPRPMPRPGGAPSPLRRIEEVIAEARLEGAVSYSVIDVATGEVIEARAPAMRLSPASVAKAATALYALEVLGPGHRFDTRLIATGPLVDGRLEGDLILAGGGDPHLDSDALGDLAADLKAAGVREVTGQFRLWAGALPALPFIDAEQPDHVGYNPAISGLNLNFNRVHFEWKRAGQGHEITMQARAARFRPEVATSRMRIEDRSAPIFGYTHSGGVDRWSVARSALGAEGARWLPVRLPAQYAGDVFATLARSHGIVLRPGPALSAPPAGAVLARHQSAPIAEILADMLRYSTNLTAEAVGLAASQARGGAPQTLAASASMMNDWLRMSMGARTPGFVDHSGLGYGSQLSSVDMARIIAEAGRAGALRALIRPASLPPGEVPDPQIEAAVIHAKTGTLNFVSALAGYLTCASGRELSFAIFTADTARRDAIPPEARERPDGARAWSSRSRGLQRKLLAHWAKVHAT